MDPEVKTTAASASLPGGGGKAAVAFRRVGRSPTTSSSRGVRQGGRADPAAGPAQRPGRNQRLRDADQVRGRGGLDRGVHPRRPEPGVDQHDGRGGAPAGVERHGQIDAGRDHQRHPVAGSHPGVHQTGRRAVDEVGEPGEGQGARAAPPHFHDRGPIAQLAVGVQQGRRLDRDRRGRDIGLAVGVVVGLGVGPVVGPVVGFVVTVAQGADPVRDHAGHVDVLGHQMPGPGVAVDDGVREPALQVVQVHVREDRIGRSPHHQDRHVAQRVQTLGDPVQHRRAGMVRLDRDVGDEILDRRPPVRGSVGGEETAADPGVQARAGHRQRPVDEGGRPHGQGAQHPSGTGEPDDDWPVGPADRGVGQHDAGQPVPVPQRPAQRHRAAPVVSDGDHGALEAELVGQVGQLVDAFAGPPQPAAAFGEPHVQLVDRDDPDPRRGLPDELAEQVRPGRVAVHAQQGQHRVAGLVVQDVPGPADAVGPGHPDQPGPDRVEPVQILGRPTGGR